MFISLVVTEKLQQMDSKGMIEHIMVCCDVCNTCHAATKEKEELMQNQEELKRLIDEGRHEMMFT